MGANQYYQMTPEEYLEWEPRQEIRYEYIDGDIFAMTGGSKPHNRIALNLAGALDSHLQGKGCEVYIADVKVQVSAAGPYHYPDVVVTCDRRDQDSSQVVQYPCLIAEVLSPSTEAYDRGSKFTHYRKLETLQEYVLIQSEAIGVECFRRNAEGLWVLHPYEVDDTITLASVDLVLPIAALYRQVRFAAEMA
ncbi:Uma2 family endonuclease [Leptolyngbya sp. FACHB-36]|uniref:Uma2 family endonuclease n=1 Tax=Leptolyngbya sp. FACHB-36 TaxID=2692808 RepID=UPI00168154B8|nr:Uma2 family endonuclease [Leptolyngbya sp. FACHB-36]MBD2022349.1 Uma2 family endonuclease [Leptolyngbya sp. FACHB-36]